MRALTQARTTLGTGLESALAPLTALEQKGRALVQQGNVSLGIDELRAAVLLDDRIADGHFQLGRALMRAGAKDEGKRELERARELQEKRRSAEGERFRKKLP